jgi:rRNA maturation RNase YbeY
MAIDLTDAGKLLPRRGHGSATRLRNAGKALLAAVDHGGSQLSIVLVDDEEMTRLNRRYRGRRKTTDVLSFAQLEGDEIESPDAQHLGDVVVSVPVAKRQAKDGGWTLEEELLRLIVHGLLHVLGYDHEKSSREERRMRREEARLCELLGSRGYACAREDVSR